MYVYLYNSVSCMKYICTYVVIHTFTIYVRMYIHMHMWKINRIIYVVCVEHKSVVMYVHIRTE